MTETVVTQKTQVGLSVVLVMITVAVAWGILIADMQNVKEEIQSLKLAVASLERVLHDGDIALKP